ncbi:alpha/beta hydrolase [Arthrobacter sp.]|uniref:alpha/beta fold hydrolase n=1 Tax=Arthrobacter sp. TaxID=1667 RepID=UPI002897EBD9|nr:alpha/beta hydrolase [Arthrobacter sp.]
MAQQRVVFVHGAGRFGAAAWPRQHVLAGRYDCLFLRRHGYRPDLPPAPTDHRADAAAVLAALGDGGHVVAHAEGAIAAMMAAVQSPERVWSLSLCEPAVFSLTRDLPATAAHRAHLDALFRDARQLDDDEYAREYRRLVYSAEAASASAADPQAAARQRLQSPPWDAPLEIVPGIPTLVLTGEWEPLYEEAARFLASTGADHRAVGGNHRPQDIEAGQEAITGFLARCAAASVAC